jgi:eukaryotic-like serine/threonine-protein kinase
MTSSYNLGQVSFELKREIGHEGKNSTAYVAHDIQLDAEIVIKKVSKDSIDSLENFFNESKILYLSSHPNVVQIHYACQDDKNVYIAMPYYKNGSLNSFMNSKFLTVREIIVFGCQISSGLHNVHSKKLIHFDVKPDNILLSHRGEALISDFGLSKATDFSGRAYQNKIYSKMLPPEVYRGDFEFNHLFDVYQLGLTLYRMCNGNSMFYEQFNRYGNSPDNFDGDKFKLDIMSGRFPDRQVFLEHIPDKLRKIVKKCLQPLPTDRYRATIEVVNDLAGIDGNILDWRFSFSNSVKFWEKSGNNTVYRLEVSEGRASLAEKTTASGKKTKIGEYCKETITPREIRNFLEGH